VILDIDDATVGENFSLANVKVFKLHEMNFIDDYTSDSGYTIQIKNIEALTSKQTTTSTTVTTTTLSDITTTTLTDITDDTDVTDETDGTKDDNTAKSPSTGYSTAFTVLLTLLAGSIATLCILRKKDLVH
ncbi:MAG: hypothetical protein GX136_00535, partial [Clostridiales bacterium]|nr:hypothetical protein [Clostridiales bacterium]